MNPKEPIMQKIQKTVDHLADLSLSLDISTNQFGYKPLMCSQNIRPTSNSSSRYSNSIKSGQNFTNNHNQNRFYEQLNQTYGNSFRFSPRKNRKNSNQKSFIKQLQFNSFLKKLYEQKRKDLKIPKNKKQEDAFIQKFKNKISEEFLDSCSSDLGIRSIKCICNYLISKPIQILKLDKNPIGDQGIIQLSKIIPKIKLKQLSLVSVNIGQKSGKYLIKSLQGLSQLKIVNFSSAQGVYRNRFGKGIAQFESVLSHQNCSLQKLNLNSINIGQQNLQSFSIGIKKDSTLKQLYLADNDLKVKHIQLFYNHLKNTRIKILNISSNNLGDDGIRFLGDIIGTGYGYNSLSQSLQNLNISNNGIRSYGLQSFSRGMIQNQMLKQLDLSQNPLSQGERFFNFKIFIHRHWVIKKLNIQKCITNAQDIKHLCEGLVQNRSLEDLNLSKTYMDLQSFQHVINMLGSNKAIKKIDLEYCNITDAFIQKCQRIIQAIKVAQIINFSNNYISDKGGKLLMEILHTTKSIGQVNLRKNCLGLKSIQMINDVLKFNKKCLQENQQPDLRYYNYVQQIQQNQQMFLKSTIQKITQQGLKTQRTLVLYKIAQKQIEQQQKKKEIEAQLKKIKELQKMMQEKLKKQKQEQKNKTFCTS